MSGGYFKRFWRALFSPVTVLAWIVASSLFFVSGPFGTYEHLSAVPRLVLWFFVVGVSILLGIAIRVAVQTLRPDLSYIRASLIATVLSALILGAGFPPFARAVLALSDPFLPSQLEVAIVVMILGVGIATLRCLLTREPQAVVRDVGTTKPEAHRPKLLSRLPDEFDGEILHLSVDDHYVEVETDQGRARLLMRFSDAIQEVEHVDGARVHRSHWVARSAVADIQRRNGRTFLLLKNGAKVPVSRAYLETVDELAAR